MSEKRSKVKPGEKKILINFADMLDLRRIPGIGDKLSQSIIFMRGEVGSLTRSKLAKLPGINITDSMLQAIDFASEPPALDDSAFQDVKPVFPETTLSAPDSMLKPPQPIFDEGELTGAHGYQDGYQGGYLQPGTLIPGQGVKLKTANVTQQVWNSTLAQESEKFPAYTNQQKSYSYWLNNETEDDYEEELAKESFPVYTPPEQQYTTTVKAEHVEQKSTNEDTMTQVLVLLQQFMASQQQQRIQEVENTPTSSDDKPEPTKHQCQCKHTPVDELFSAPKVRRDLIRYIPRNLTFDGTGNWLVFQRKFNTYSTMYKLTPEERGSIICWCLIGKAADYYAAITERKDLPYEALMKKLEGRYGTRELSESARIKFSQAVQNQGETIESWADRLLILATTAFRELPESFARQQVCLRFCQGLLNKDAGHHIGAQHPKTIEEALEKVMWYQHMYQMVHNRPGRQKRSSQVPESEEDSIMAVQHVCSTEEILQQLQTQMERLSVSLTGRSSGTDSQN